MKETNLPKDVLIVDVRTEKEFKTGACPGAVNIPLTAIEKRLSEFEPRNRPILTYCASGTRGNMAAILLQTFGWDKACCAGSLANILRIVR